VDFALIHWLIIAMWFIKNFHFSEEAKQFNARLASSDANRSIDIVLDSLSGTIAGTLNIFCLLPISIPTKLNRAN